MKLCNNGSRIRICFKCDFFGYSSCIEILLMLGNHWPLHLNSYDNKIDAEEF